MQNRVGRPPHASVVFCTQVAPHVCNQMFLAAILKEAGWNEQSGIQIDWMDQNADVLLDSLSKLNGIIWPLELEFKFSAFLTGDAAFETLS